MPQPTILIVDDELEIRHLLRAALEKSAFHVREANSVGALWQSLNRFGHPDLILLDLTLPDGDGIEAAQELRVQYNIPVIMVTGRVDSIDKIIGLESGADDYISKPFDLRELVARVRSVLRRSGQTTPVQHDMIFVFDDWRYDPNTWALEHADIGPVRLTQYEAKLLHQLLETNGKVLTRKALAEVLGGRDYHPQDRSIDNLVSRLRKKLNAVKGSPDRIRSILTLAINFWPM